jgi:hypothetical protein
VVVGALVRSASGDDDADALHFAARLALRAARRAFHETDKVLAPVVRETELEPGLIDMQTDGALLLSAYRIEYVQDYPAP